MIHCFNLPFMLLTRETFILKRHLFFYTASIFLNNHHGADMKGKRNEGCECKLFGELPTSTYQQFFSVSHFLCKENCVVGFYDE